MIDAQGNYVPETPQITTPVPTVNASTVYSPQNVATTLSNPVAKPNLADPYGLYDYYMNSADIQGANTQLKSITDQYNQSLSTSRAQQTALENLPRESMAFIGTAQQRAGTLANQQLQSLSEARNSQIAYLDTLKSRAGDLYGIATQERGKLQELIAMTGGKAGISYTDSFESALQKATKYTEDKAKEDAKDAYKKELKAQLLALGKSTKGLSTNELEKKLKKYNKSVLEEAKRMSEIQYQTALSQLQNLKSGGGGTAGERVGSAGADAQNALLSSKGSDGFVDPGVYVSQRANYMRSGGSSSDFDSQFGNLLSPQEQGSIGVSSNPKTIEQKLTEQKAQQTASSALNIVQRLKTAGSALGNAVGPISSKLPTLRGSTADFEQNYNALKSLLTLENMGVMKGVLSDADIKIIQNASANLSLGQSESGFKKELDNIQSILENRLGGNLNDPLNLGF